MTDLHPTTLPRQAWILGGAGLIPQVLALLYSFHEHERYIALAAGYFYAALILSFLGGIWWGVAASRPTAPRWLFGAAVVPSLIAFASGKPWMTGETWPGPSLMLLGWAILLASTVDAVLYREGHIARDLFGLRLLLSLGLGGLTLALSAQA